MNDQVFQPNQSPRSDLQQVVGKLWGCLQDPTPADSYLASATDHAELERRMRQLERAGDTPMFVTFNH